MMTSSGILGIGPHDYLAVLVPGNCDISSKIPHIRRTHHSNDVMNCLGELLPGAELRSELRNIEHVPW
jgi:hypothetical protein